MDSSNGQHLCTTCKQSFLTCHAGKIVWGIDKNPHAKGADADRVLECDGYAKSDHQVKESEVKYLIWSNRKGMWWRANSIGYTASREEAGVYEMSEAVEICTRGYNVSMSPSTAIPDNVMFKADMCQSPKE